MDYPVLSILSDCIWYIIYNIWECVWMGESLEDALCDCVYKCLWLLLSLLCVHCDDDCLTPPFALFLFFISLLITSASTYVYTYASLFCLRPILFSIRLLRKLPWLSRQSDRLLTDRSLVRSQAEAPFLLLLSVHPVITIYSKQKVRLPWVSNPRPRG